MVVFRSALNILFAIVYIRYNEGLGEDILINVTKTYLPDKQKYLSYVDKIYETGWITNNGLLVQELQLRLADYLGVKNILLVDHGTRALEVAYKLLNLKGEVITTPFSFVATTSSLVSNCLKPIFADIDPGTFNLDPKNIEAAISEQTSAILPVHVFGNACEIEKIEKIADKHNLKVIYDAAHTFGVNYKDKNLLCHGDISAISFHATKLFHTIEGGALIINDDSLVEEAKYFINFGIDGPESIKALGINAKMNEFEAAMGLCILDEIDLILEQREEIYNLYHNALKGVVEMQIKNLDATNNYGYFPILLSSEKILLNIEKELNNNGIFPRRYFHPSLNTLPYIDSKQVMPISQNIASRILCLPIYAGLDQDSIQKITNIIIKGID